MHVTVVGAGVLGRIYGARLAADGEEVSFVVRPDRASDTSPFVIEQVNGGDRRDVIERPRRVTEIPEDASLVLVAVRSHELSPGSAPASFDVPSILRGGRSRSAPAVILTPMLPGEQAALEKGAGRRIVPAMPGVAGYLNERGVVRYWIPTATSTLISDASERGGAEDGRAVLDALARKLTQLGLPARLERDVAALNASTTVAFFPLIAAIDAGSGVDGVLGDRELLGVVLDAAKESDALARKLGKAATWTNVLLKFVGPFTLKPGVALARRLFPESVLFVERHFGPKLHEQHLAMGDAILALGRERGVTMPSLERLMDVLRRKPAAG
jgi:2-dehydropantoate 2-reductase